MECGKIWGILTVIGAAFINLSFGYNYSIGNMNPYIIAYLGITKSQSIWFNAVLLAGQAVGMPIGGMLASKIGFRLVVIFGSIMTSGGVMLSSLTIKYNFGAFLTTYSIMFGLGMGLPYSVLFSVASSWFPMHRAAVVGIIAAGLGLGSFVFSPIQTALINPHNIQDLTDPRVKDNIPKTFLVLGGFMLALQFVGICLCRKCKEILSNDKTLSPTSIGSEVKGGSLAWSESSAVVDDKEEDEKTKNEPVSYTVAEALRSIDFYIIFFMIFLDVIPITLQTSTYKVYGKDSLLDDRFLSHIASISSAFNCIGRISWGLISDRFSFKLPLGWMLLQWALFMGTFAFIDKVRFMNVLYAIWVFILFFTMAGHFVLMPAACTSCFGPKHMATIYGLLYLATAPSSLLLSAIISQFDIEGKWTEVFLSCTAVLCIGFIMSLFLHDEKGTCTKISKPCAAICDPCRPEPSRVEDYFETDFNEIGVYA
ncbi:hypothetical protein SprV_0501850000 [Sparganum proliferum]